MERLALDALAILDALDVERAHVCGLSLGGLVALQLAIYHRSRIGRAVFANTAARVGTAALWDAQLAAMQASGAPNVEEIALATFLSDGFRQRQPEATRLVRDMLSATSLNGYLGCFAALLRHGRLRAVRLRAKMARP